MKITDTDRINWLEEQESKVDGGDSGKMWQSWEITRDWDGSLPDKTVRDVIDEEILSANAQSCGTGESPLPPAEG